MMNTILTNNLPFYLIKFLLCFVATGFIIPGSGIFAKQQDNEIPRIFSLEEMPKVDVHVHIRDNDHIDAYVDVMDRVGIDVSVALNSVSEEGFEYAQRHYGRLLFAPRRDFREDMWWTREELVEMADKGYAGTKLWVVYSDLINKPEFSRSIGYQGEAGLPLIGMHIANPPAAIVNLEDFEEQIANAIRVVEENPQTTFIMAHGFWHMLEDRWLERLDGYFQRYPNLYVDLSAAAQAFGFDSLDRAKLRSFMITWKDRILFGTDAGMGHSDDRFYYYWYRVLETDQKNLRGFFGGEIGIQGLALPLDVLNHIYWWNAARLIPRVHDSLLALGYPIDQIKDRKEPPRIVGARSGSGSGTNSAVNIRVKTDIPSVVRWSYSNIPYERMNPARTFESGHDQTTHQLLFTPAGKSATLFLSAGSEDGLPMTTAVPVTVQGITKSKKTTSKFIHSDIAAYQVVAMDESDGPVHTQKKRFSGLENFRELYMRFSIKPNTDEDEQTLLWKIMRQPNPNYSPEEYIEGVYKKGLIDAFFQVDGELGLQGEAELKNEEWQHVVVRMDIHRNLFDVTVNGEAVITNSDKTQLAGMWGDGFDSIILAPEVRDLLILAGPGSYQYTDTNDPDHNRPSVDMVFPNDGAQSIEPGSPVLLQFSDEGLGLDTETVRVFFNEKEQQVHLLGALNRGFMAVNLSEEFTGKEVSAKVVFRDLAVPSNQTEFSWFFHVGEQSAQASGENIAQGKPVTVEKTYVVPERLLLEGRISYNTESLTDGQIEPEGGSTTSWASGTNGRQSQWVEIDFEETRSVSEIYVYPVANHGVYQTPAVLIAEIWNGDQFEPVAASFSPKNSEKVIIRVPAIKTEKVRITQPPFVSGLLWLTEIQVFEAN